MVLGFCGMEGRAARGGLDGLELTGPPGEPEEETALRRGAVSGLFSPQGTVFSEDVVEKSGLLMEELGDLFSGVGGCGLTVDTQKGVLLY